MGIIYRDPEDSYYDEAEFAIVKGNTVLGNLMDDVRVLWRTCTGTGRN